MDDTIKMMISGYETGIQNYRKKLGDDNTVVIKAVKCIEDLYTIAEDCKDINDFSLKTSGKLSEISNLFMELFNEKPSNTVPMDIPSAQQIAQGYHVAFSSINDKEKFPETVKVYERIFELEKLAENGIQFMKMITEEGLLVKMTSYNTMEVSKSGLIKDAENISVPQMVIYHKNTIEEMQKAKSIAEINYYSNIRSDISYYESQWDTLFTIMTFVNLSSAIISYMMLASEENRQGVEYSYRFFAKYFGITFDELIALPRIYDYFIKMEWRTIKDDCVASGVTTPEKYFETYKNVLVKCFEGRPPLEIGSEEKKQLTFFGTKYHMKEFPGVYEKAPHPDDSVCSL